MENEILIALIGKMVDERLGTLPVVPGARGPRGSTGPAGQDFVFADHEETIRAWAKEITLKFNDLTDDQIAALRGPQGRDGRDGQDGKNFVFSEHEEAIREFSKEFAVKFEDLSEDQIKSLRGPRGRDGSDGADGRSFRFEENRNEIEGIIREHVVGLSEELRLKFSDLSADDIEQLRGPRGRDGHDGRHFVFDEHREYFDGLRLKFSDLSDAEKDSLKLQFSNLTEVEKNSLKLKFSDLTEEDLVTIKGPRGLRGQRGSAGRDGESIKGDKGDQGPRGVPGVAINGRDGIDGRDGTDGVDAPTIVSIDVDEYGDEIVFVFYFSDGSSLRSDRVRLPTPVEVVGGTTVVSKKGGSVDYEINVDEVDADTTYVGYARPGSDTSDGVWKIKRILIVGTETQIEWAESNALFDKIWDDRASLIYG